MAACIEHNQVGNPRGYGGTRWGDKKQMLHRLAYCYARQVPIEYIKGAVVRHTCDNPRCINPQHLILGTQDDNLQDMVERGRSLVGVRHSNVKLTVAAVLYIREHYRPRCKVNSGAALAKQFGVTFQTISKIVNRETWQHLPL